MKRDDSLHHLGKAGGGVGAGWLWMAGLMVTPLTPQPTAERADGTHVHQ